MHTPLVSQGIPVRTQSMNSSLDSFAASNGRYSLKHSKFDGKAVSYLMQGLNGPCPLLAICNVLLLRRLLSLPDGSRGAEFDQLIQHIANMLIERSSGSDDIQKSILTDSFGILGTLNQGMDVNIRFTAVDAFDHTKETAVFEVLGIRLLHGWIVSEDDYTVYPYLSPLSYNEAVEKVAYYEEVKAKAVETGNFDDPSVDPNRMGEGEAIAQWLQQTSSQMTSDGVIEINSQIKNGDLAVFFRNNHFSVIHKREDRLYALVTDIGYAKTSVMWESIDQLDGDTLYLDSSFSPVTAAVAQTGPESDYEMALRLQYSQSPPTIAVPAQNVSVTRPVEGQPIASRQRQKKSSNCKCSIM